MSFQALAWAAKARLSRASEKLILLAFADRHNEENGFAYPSIAWLTEFSSLDRKTVMNAIERLVEAGFLTDSGKRTGATKQIKVYSVNVGTVPKTEQSQKRNSPVFSAKESQKRDTEPVRNHTIPSEGKPSSGIDTREPKVRPSKRCPDHWLPSHADLATAEAEGFAPGEIERELAKFRDHTFGTARKDWSATFRNWIRTAKDRKPRQHDPSAPSPKLLAKQANLERAFAGFEAIAGRRAG